MDELELVDVDKKRKCDCASREAENFTTTRLVHHFIRLEDRTQELGALLYFLESLTYRQIIVYVRTSSRCATLSAYLKENGHPRNVAIHRSIPDQLRQQRFKEFQKGIQDHHDSPRILVTSCCNHGMECRNVDVVINFDEAETPGRYNHRVCSKISRKGLVLSFIRKEKFFTILKKFQKLYNVKVSPLPLTLQPEAYCVDPSEDDTEDGYTFTV